MEEGLVIAGITVAAGGAVLLRARLFPYGPCPRCSGCRGRGVGSTSKAYNRCGRSGCRGGERIRPISRVYKVWRDEDRARKEK